MSSINIKLSALLIRVAIVGAFVALCGCAKEGPPIDYFEQCLTGDWCVKEFFTSDGVTIIHDQDDCVQYQGYFDCKTYTTDNPAFCNLKYIDEIQKWEIRKGGSVLNIRVLSLCGYEEDFQVSYTTPYYSEYHYGSSKTKDCISTRITFLSRDTTIVAEFTLLPDSHEIWITEDEADGMQHQRHLCKLGSN